MSVGFRYQFVRGTDLESKLIAFGGAGDFSHVDILLDDGSLLGARLEGGVAIRPAGYEPWSKQVVIEIPCSGLAKDAALTFAHAQVGKPYDKLAIAAFVVGRDWREEGEWFCSELGARTGEVGALWPVLYTPANKVTPVELALVCSAVPGRIITVIK